MKDIVGKLLQNKRIEKVIPCIEGKLLDIGCGLNNLVKRYGNGIGVDVYNWGSVDMVVENSAKLPFDSDSFDTVTILAALNHIPNRNEVIIESHRILKRDGKLIITMIPPGISRVWHTMRSRWDVDQAERGMQREELYGIRAGELIQMVLLNGFILVKKERFMLGINCMFVFKKY
jgi:ubiquinone/menaquinone biosynthesis C-methylase UbiE